MLLERMGETVTLETADGETFEVEHVLCREADQSDQTVMDVQTRFINQARYKGDSRTVMAMWPKDAPTHDLMDSHIVIRGERYRVYASPFPVAHPRARYDMRVTCIRSLFLYDAALISTDLVKDQWGRMEEVDTPTPVKVNLLRLSETIEDAARASELAKLVLIELRPGDYDPSHVKFAFDGDTYHVTSIERAGDVVVLSGRREA